MVTEAQQMKAEIDEMFVELVADGLATSCTVRTTPVTSSNMVAGTVTEGTPVNVSARCVLTGINERNAPGAVIEIGDKLAIVDKEVGANAVIIIGSVVWTVVSVIQVEPGPTFMISKAQVRR